MSRLLPTSKGPRTIVDDEDYEWAKKYRWSTHSGGYAVRAHRVGGYRGKNGHPGKRGRLVFVYLHREILAKRLGRPLTQDEEGDHKDGIPLNNQRHNLRLATRTQQMKNQKIRCTNKSGYTGVSWYAAYGRWAAEIKADGVKRFLGYFEKLNDAADARQTAEQVFGEWSRNSKP